MTLSRSSFCTRKLAYDIKLARVIDFMGVVKQQMRANSALIHNCLQGLRRDGVQDQAQLVLRLIQIVDEICKATSTTIIADR